MKDVDDLDGYERGVVAGALLQNLIKPGRLEGQQDEEPSLEIVIPSNSSSCALDTTHRSVADARMTAFETIALPRALTFDALTRLVQAWPDTSRSIRVCFHPEQWVHPTGIVGLACLIEASQKRGAAVEVSSKGCPSATYWGRMGFFEVLGLASPPATNRRRRPSSRFSELRRVDDIHRVDEVTEALVNVTSPDDGTRELFNHVISEALNNVCQHSNADGFCLAQHYPQQKKVRVCIADYGIGLREALTFFSPSSDLGAIEKAIEVGVTGGSALTGSDEMRNRGVGLSAIRGLVTKNRGELAIWSGTGIRRETQSIDSQDGPYWQGTLISVTMPRDDFSRSFKDIMRDLVDELREIERARQKKTKRRS